MKRRDLERHLRAHGAELLREGANHSVWAIGGPDSERIAAVPPGQLQGKGSGGWTAGPQVVKAASARIGAKHVSRLEAGDTSTVTDAGVEVVVLPWQISRSRPPSWRLCFSRLPSPDLEAATAIAIPLLGFTRRRVLAA